MTAHWLGHPFDFTKLTRSMLQCFLLVYAVLLHGCATLPREAFTHAEHNAALIPGFDAVRFVSGSKQGFDRLVTAMTRHGQERAGTPFTLLALSGGGANGAYGAGVLNGWTRSGDRPQFSVVTGVSTGALIAPFAYLGPAWDEQLRHAYTSGAASRLIGSPGLRPLTGDSVFSGKPLRRLVETYVTDDMIRGIAQENAKGRLLLVATTNLDSQSLVIWDIGAIASRGGSAARRMVVDVLVASAAIPGVFPPVMIESATGTRRIREMHVDGTMISAFFAVPEAALITPGPKPLPSISIYILINGKADAEFEVTRHALLPVIERSYGTTSKASQRTALSAIAAFGRTNGIATWVTAIPAGEKAAALDFGRVPMARLFRLGEERASARTAWTGLQSALEQEGRGGIGGQAKSNSPKGADGGR